MDADREARASLDTALVRALRRDGRASVLSLARELGVPRDAVSQRLRALARDGGLLVAAAVDPGFSGHRILTHVLVRITGPSEPLARRLAEFPRTVFVSRISGSKPIIVELRHGDAAELQSTLQAIRELPGVQRTYVSTYVDVLKGFFVAKQRYEIETDERDLELIALLQGDGRMSFRELAEAVHLSPSAVRTRVRRLIDAGVIRISAIKSGGLSGSRLAIGLGLGVVGDPAPVRARLQESGLVDFAASAHGMYDFIATVAGGSARELLAEIEALRSVPGVASVDSWTHYDIVKEHYERAVGRAVAAP